MLHRPRDPAALGAFRAAFGLLMALDVPQERGLARLDHRYLDGLEVCRFPLLPGLRPLPLDWMYLVYGVMLLGALGIMLGFCYRLSTLAFLGPYWYLLLLDKTTWNNHSYLYGLLAFQLALVGGCGALWGVCGALWGGYGVYMGRYGVLWGAMGGLWGSMGRLWGTGGPGVPMGGVLVMGCPWGGCWLWGPGYGVPMGGCSGLWGAGYGVPMGCPWLWGAQGYGVPMGGCCLWGPGSGVPVLGCSWLWGAHGGVLRVMGSPWGAHGGGSRLWGPHGGGAAYGVPVLGCPWPWGPAVGVPMGLCSLLRPPPAPQTPPNPPGPISIFWGGGVPEKVFTQSRRWKDHADMLKQYSTCLSAILPRYNISQPQLYFDIWVSINERFQQRLVDPRVDLVRAEWSPWRRTPWLLPLLLELSPWRERLQELESGLDGHTDVVFIADFPGLHLENFVSEDLGNTSLRVLRGEVLVELVEQRRNHSLREGEGLQVPPGEYHKVHTVSPEPSCYMYTYVNTTALALEKNLTRLQELRERVQNGTETEPLPPELRPILGEPLAAGTPSDPVVAAFLRRQRRLEELGRRREASLGQRLHRFLRKKYYLFRRSALMTLISLRNLALGRPPLEQLAQEVAFANWRGEEEEGTRPEGEGQASPEL
uniref:Vitamin K-dependent gamma-carboxylase n=1 Tax=Cairina moschata TaxID=8855 RepID=A0A8C3CI31_CAIMO